MTANSKYINPKYYDKYSKYLKNNKQDNKINTNIRSNNRENKKRSQNNFDFNHINILGIDLFSDDILLILLIYFLYTEGVKDIYLFIILILLLLS